MYVAEIKVQNETKHKGQFHDLHDLKVWAHKQGVVGYDFDYEAGLASLFGYDFDDERGLGNLYVDKERKAVLLVYKV